MINLDEGEWESIRIGTHAIYIANEDGEPEINIRDHLDMRVEGQHKGDVSVVFTAGEFGATFEQIGEREFFERYVMGERDED